MIEQPSRSRVVALAAGWALAASVAGAQTAQAPLSPAKGDVIPGFETLGVDGKPAKIDFPKGSRTMLLFFLSGCPHCHKMIPEWNRVYEQKVKNLKIVGVIMDPDQAPASFWTEHPVAFPVVRSPGREFLRTLNVNRAPTTLRVGEAGRVEDVAVGERCSGSEGVPGVTCVDPIHFGLLFAPGPAQR
jgi:peroxiredoxin